MADLQAIKDSLPEEERQTIDQVENLMWSMLQSLHLCIMFATYS